MNEKLANVGADALKGLMEFAKGAKEFTLEQAPLVAREMVLFGRVWWTSVSIIGTAALVLGAMSFYMVPKYHTLYMNTERPRDAHFEAMGNAWLVVGVISAIFFGLALASGAHYNAFLAWFAPRLYIIKQIAEAVK